MQPKRPVIPESIPSLRAIPAVPASGEVAEGFDERRSADDLLTEMAALNAAAAVTDQREDPEEARRLVGEAFATRRRLLPIAVEEYAIDCAMAKILGEDAGQFVVPTPPADEQQWTTFALRTILNAWTMWANGQLAACLASIGLFRTRQREEEKVSTSSGAINLMSMYLWAGAIEALASGEHAEARRLWKRALELATHRGTQSSILVQWTYVASFFPN